MQTRRGTGRAVKQCMGRLLNAAMLAAMLLASPPARADDDPPMRGRTNHTTFEEGVLWVPRIVFFPFHLFAEYGLRRPAYAAAAWADREHVPAVVTGILHPTPSFEWAPTVVLDLGVDAAMGGSMVLRNPFASGEELRASASAGPNVVEFEARDRHQWGPVYAGVRGHTNRRARPFYGLGPDSGNQRAYFAQMRLEGFAFGGFEQRHFQLEAWEGLRREHVGHAEASPSVETMFHSLPGFAPLDLAMLGVDLRLDSRDKPEENGGIRVLANATYAQDMKLAERSFVTTELDAEAAIEVSKPDRVLTARFYGADSLPFGREPVPLTHLPMLGWRNHLGFIWGRFRGESALMAELRYRWPIAYFVDAQIAVSAGNVFARDLSDFNAAKLTTSFAVGIRTRRTGLSVIEAMVGFGTTRFEERFDIPSLRLYLGVTEGL